MNAGEEIPAGAQPVQLHGRIAAGRIAFVDASDFDLVSQYRWYAWEERRQGVRGTSRTAGPYATTTISLGRSQQATLRMHKLIAGWPLTDHINHDGLDNRRSNLREADQRRNAQNKRSGAASSSRFKGVSWRKRSGAWIAQITVDGQIKWLGTFACDLDAARAYDAAALQHFGEFACPNFPSSGREPSAA